jgi:valyl-tRNA synthetase
LQISPKEVLEWKENQENNYDCWIEKLCNLSKKKISDDNSGKLIVTAKRNIYIEIPETLNNKSAEEEIKKLTEELEYLKGFLESVRKKLSNEKFIQNAKAELVEKERQKEKDALNKIATIEEQLKKLQVKNI